MPTRIGLYLVIFAIHSTLMLHAETTPVAEAQQQEKQLVEQASQEASKQGGEDPKPPQPDPSTPKPPQPSPAPNPAPVPSPEPREEKESKQTSNKKRTTRVINEPRKSETKISDGKRINPKYKITKIHDFRNDDKLRHSHNQPLEFERSYWEYGAILADEHHKKQGHYFVITWVNNDVRADFTTRFEYRQVNSKSIVRTLELTHPHIKGAERSIFAVTGDAYEHYGPVCAWRFTVLKGDVVVAQDKSFVW